MSRPVVAQPRFLSLSLYLYLCVSLSLSLSSCKCLGGDVLTRCMVEGSVAPIGGLTFERSHWSNCQLVAAVWWQRDSSGVALPLIGGEEKEKEVKEEGVGWE